MKEEKRIISCQFQIWNSGHMCECGQLGTMFTQPKLMMKLPEFIHGTVCLCPEHRAFVADCINRQEIELAKIEKRREAKQKKLKFTK